MADDQDGDEHPEHRVEDHREDGDLDRDLKGMQRVWLRQLVPHRAEPVLEGAPEDQPDWQHEQEQQVRERRQSQSPLSHGARSSA